MKLNWKNSFLYLSILATESCWLFSLISILNAVADGEILSIAGLLAIYPISFIVNRLLLPLKIHSIPLFILNVALWAAAMLISIKFQLFSQSSFKDTDWLMAFPLAVTKMYETFKPALMIFLSSAAMWYLGRRVANMKINFSISTGEFQFGLILLALLFFSSSQISLDMWYAIPVAVIFLFFSLLAMAISHAQEGAGWILGSRRGHWTILLIISIFLVIFIGFIISTIVTPDFINLIISAIKWLWALFNKVLAYLANLFPPSEPAEPIVSEIPELIMPTAEPGKIFLLPEILRKVLQFGWAILFGGMLAFALWRIMSYVFSRLRKGSNKGEETETLRGAFKADLLNLLRGFLFPFKRLWSLLHIRKRTIRIPDEIASIRAIYRHLLRWAASNGYPRLPSQTPHEYLGVLTNLMPEAEGDLNLITQYYVNIRYGVSFPHEDELYQAKQSWHNIKRCHLKKPQQNNTVEVESNE
ncbi:DUF4129 domain-containing protein [Chloroflexota bacterium]